MYTKGKVLSFGLTVENANNLSMNLLKYQLASRLDSKLNFLFEKCLPRDFYKMFIIDDIKCINKTTKQFSVSSIVKFNKNVVFYDYLKKQNGSYSEEFGINNLINFLLSDPIRESTTIPIIIKDFPKVIDPDQINIIQYNFECSDLERCDDNMFCDHSFEYPKCNCITGFNAIYSNKTGYMECGNFEDKCFLPEK